jgi:hypothetical protein
MQTSHLALPALSVICCSNLFAEDLKPVDPIKEPDRIESGHLVAGRYETFRFAWGDYERASLKLPASRRAFSCVTRCQIEI